MDARADVESRAREFIDDLKQWLAIPSISADPGHHEDVRRSAEWLARRLRSIGFPVAEVGESSPEGLPAVFAEWPAADPAAAKVLVYGHHDVQPVEPLEQWGSPRFEPEVLCTREGGSGPEADLAEILGAPLVFVGVALGSDQIHAPNGRVDLSLLRGAEVSAYLWEELASAGPDLT